MITRVVLPCSIRAMLLMIDCKYRILSLRGGSFAQLKKVDILDDQDGPRNILLDNNDFSKHEENLMIKLKEPPRELVMIGFMYNVM